jgi:transposase
VDRTEKRGGVSMVSAATNKGRSYWKLHEGGVNVEKFKDFVERLIRGKKRGVFGGRQCEGASRQDAGRAGAGEQKEAALYYLPPYSPGLNPDERINADVKYGVAPRHQRRQEKDWGKRRKNI